MATTTKRVFITGASGLLGRAILKTFVKAEWRCLGTAFSRAEKQGLVKVDLNDRTALQTQIVEFSPDIIIHSAAQRAPNEVEKDFEAAKKLNVEASRSIAEIGASIGAPVIYISTDYVFDGNNAPYAENDTPNPVNKYGITKLEGEKVVLEVDPTNIVLRVSVLYGEVELLGESAVTVLMESLLDSKQEHKVSNYEIRFPSNVNDIAEICYHLAAKRLADPSVSGIFQWSGKESMTKYKMVQLMAEAFKLPMKHVVPDVPDAEQSKNVNRPFNCQLKTSRLDKLEIGHHTPFVEGIKKCLAKFT